MILSVVITAIALMQRSAVSSNYYTQHAHILLFYTQLHAAHATPTQHSITPGSVNGHQLRLGRKKQVWFIPLADERGVCR